jgi:hypothetical protein
MSNTSGSAVWLTLIPGTQFDEANDSGESKNDNNYATHPGADTTGADSARTNGGLQPTVVSIITKSESHQLIPSGKSGMIGDTFSSTGTGLNAEKEESESGMNLMIVTVISMFVVVSMTWTPCTVI